MAYDETYVEPESVEVLVKAAPAGEGDDGGSCQDGEEGFVLPAYAMEGDAGADLHTRVDVSLEPFERALVPTGISLALPAGYVGLVHPRSGLAARMGVTVLNAPGTIDAGYRGEIKVPLINLDPRERVVLHAGDRIAQLVIQRYVQARFIPADRLPGSERSESGFGSTGL